MSVMRRKILKAEAVNLDGRLIVACGDLHVRESTPTMRTEKDFFAAVVEPKLEWIVETSNKYKAPICIAGDIFDQAGVRYFVANRTAQILREAKYGIYTVPGQHDMNFHSQLLMDTPYQSLMEARVIKDVHGGVRHAFEDKVLISGAGFGIEPRLYSDILLAHSCITENNPPFFLEDALSADDYLRLYDQWRIIISGDYHVSHVTRKDNRILVNCGPMFRKDKTQIDVVPKAYLINIDDLSYQALFIPHRPGNEAFDLAKIERVKKLGLSASEVNTDKLQKLITGTDTKTALDYSAVVTLVCAQYEDETGVRVPKEKLLSILQRAKNG